MWREGEHSRYMRLFFGGGNIAKIEGGTNWVLVRYPLPTFGSDHSDHFRHLFLALPVQLCPQLPGDGLEVHEVAKARAGALAHLVLT